MSTFNVSNPVEPFLRSDRMPHIWCPGCGIGTTVNCFARALIESKVDLQSLALVSGIGCTGRVAGYVKLDSFHTTHGRAIPFATGLKLANPKLSVCRVLRRWRSLRDRGKSLDPRSPAKHRPEGHLRQ
jgi:2-oxoglutarate/2-oxoacid ferredoxin oxidoreductase subunit beta